MSLQILKKMNAVWLQYLLRFLDMEFIGDVIEPERSQLEKADSGTQSTAMNFQYQSAEAGADSVPKSTAVCRTHHRARRHVLMRILTA